VIIVVKIVTEEDRENKMLECIPKAPVEAYAKAYKLF
jgi:hypothetical protein